MSARSVRRTFRRYNGAAQDRTSMFSIFRSQRAMLPLKETWEIADDELREDILRASRELDQQLHINPQEKGEAREGSVRIVFQEPLAVLFEVDEEKKLVRILRAWAYQVGVNKRKPLE
jgi:hypothetical protein